MAHKQLDWRHNRIALALPTDHATYARYMDAQWQYGYLRGQEALQRPAVSALPRMRNVDRYNRAQACAF